MNIPTKIYASYNKKTKIIMTIMSLIFILLAFFSVSEYSNDSSIVWIIVGTVLMLSSLFIIIVLFSVSKLGKISIELDEQSITINSLLNSKRFNWCDIKEVFVYQVNNNNFIGLQTYEDEKKKTFGKSLNTSLGYPSPSCAIVTSMYSNIDLQDFLETIEKMVNSKQPTVQESIVLPDHEIEESKSLIKTYILALLTAIICGIVYGISIALLEVNILLVPILSSYVVIAVFNKHNPVIEHQFITKLLIGFICFVQVPVGMITSLMIVLKVPISIENIINLTQEYSSYLISDLGANIGIFIAAIFCFVIGVKVKIRKINQ